MRIIIALALVALLGGCGLVDSLRDKGAWPMIKDGAFQTGQGG